MPDIHTRVSGAWKRCAGLFVRAGSWKRITQAWVRQGGVWKLVYQYDVRGQYEWSTQGTYSFIVPSGVTQVHACVVNGANNTLSAIRRGGTTLISGASTVNSAIGGGTGGAVTTNAASGGAGAGGYDGDGGAGGSGDSGGNGSGGGGGGGGGSATASLRQHGAGVYLHGAGESGVAGTTQYGIPPTAGSALGEGVPRGAGRRSSGSPNLAMPGGSLRYTKTAIPVTPGETLTIIVGVKPSTDATDEMQGGVRIIWGNGRSYPSNAKDV